MEFDFSTLSEDQIARVSKRLRSVNKSLINEYKIAMSVINSKSVNDNWGDIIVILENILSDQVGSALAGYKRSLENLQSKLKEHL